MIDIGLQKKEAATFLIFLLSGAALDSDKRIVLSIACLAAVAVLYGQAKGKGEK